MNLRKGFRITTWVLSLTAFVVIGVLGIIQKSWYDDPYIWEFYIIALASFTGIWLIYWILFWSVQGFQKIGKEKTLQIIKWAAIIFFASILFHLADHLVHKTINAFEEKPRTPRRGFSR